MVMSPCRRPILNATTSPLYARRCTRSRARACCLHLTWVTLVTGFAILSGCSIYEKEAQLPPLVRAERQLARAEKIRSDPQEKAAEILSVTRTAANRMPVTSIIEFGRPGDSTPVKARLCLINPRKQHTVEIGNERFSLAANFSAPLLSYGQVTKRWLIRRPLQKFAGFC